MTRARRFAGAGTVLLALCTGRGERPGQAEEPGTTAETSAQRNPERQPRHDVADSVGFLVAVSSMRQGRAVHTASGLRDGRILVTGGLSGEQAVSTTEIFDLATGAFRPGPPLRSARAAHTATVLRDGRVLLAGGLAGSAALSSAELFDPSTGVVTSTGSMHVARSGHIAMLLADGRVLIAGGVGDGWSFLSSVEIFDPRAGRFSEAAPMPQARESHTGTLLTDGSVLIIGGHQGRRPRIVLYSSAIRYDPERDTWTEVGRMSVPRHKHDAVRLADGRVLVVGGTDDRDSRGTYRTAEIFNPATRRFERTSDSWLAHWKHAGTLALLGDGRVLVTSGAERPELFTPKTGTFAVVPGASRMLGQFAASAALPNGDILVTGGYGEARGATAEAWRIHIP